MLAPILSVLVLASPLAAWADVSEEVFVESPTDTDNDGVKDRLYVEVSRPNSDRKLSTMYYISPYTLGGTDSPMHNVDFALLPQDEAIMDTLSDVLKGKATRRKSSHSFERVEMEASTYARVKAHSLGTGYSTGCPTVGDMSETLAAKAVIDWLNGRAKAFYRDGREAKADWANGNVGMTGVSYDGTLPIMVAATGVEGLKAIVPIAAISSWYDYYRANGLVVNPGGYIGEDADVLGYYIVRRGACKRNIELLTQTQGRENGDFTKFWQDRDYVKFAKDFKAAVFFIHGQSDWNVKMKHAIQLYEALDGVVPRRLFLHKGGHSSTYAHGVPAKIQKWFDHFVDGVQTDILSGPQVEVEFADGRMLAQNAWPHEQATKQRLYFSGGDAALTTSVARAQEQRIVDEGKSTRLESLLDSPNERHNGRLLFMTAPLVKRQLLTGTPKVTVTLKLTNRKAANVTAAIVSVDSIGNARVITRGWADPQNYRDQSAGELLMPGQSYQLTFPLEPKQAFIPEGSRLGVMLTSTDYEYTLRPAVGTEINFELGQGSFIELDLAEDI